MMRRMHLGILFIALLMGGQPPLASANQNFGPRQPVTKTKKDKAPEERYVWLLRRDLENIHVYTHNVKGSAFLEFKADTHIDAPVDKVVSLFENDEKVPSWFYHGAKADAVEKINDKSSIYYFFTKPPWPISARDIVFERTKSTDPVTGEVGFTLSSLPDRLPRKKGVVRVIRFNATWRFVPINKNQTQVHFQQYGHPEGFIPPFMANQLATNLPFYSLKNFRTLVEEKKQPNAI